MTIEQLLCPAVIRWETEYRKQLNENHVEMTDKEIVEAFDKWLVENEDIVNKSVEENIDRINETINRNCEKFGIINEGFFDDEFFNEDSDADDIHSANTDADEPEVVTVDDEEEDVDYVQKRSKLTGSVKLEDKKTKYNIYSVINDFYDMVEEEDTNYEKHSAIMSKLDVSFVTNMSALFAFTDLPNLDLVTWNTNRTRHMEGMFYKSTFNNESICDWDVSSCIDFKNMFMYCPFNKSLKRWVTGWTTEKVRNEDGQLEDKAVRAPLPIVGGEEDEIRYADKQYHRGMFNDFRRDAADADETNENKQNSNKMKYIIDFNTFVNEGKFRDFVSKGVDKIKDLFKSLSLKVGSVVAFFNKEGEILPAVSAYTALNSAANGEIPGVTAFCDVNNEYVDEALRREASVVESPEYYGILDKDSIEYRNYLTFAGMVNEHYEKFGDTGALILNEEETYKRVGFSAADGGVDAMDINSDDLREILEDLINDVPAYKGEKHGGAVFIWGAPGIGKSTIPKSICREWNKSKGDATHKKALMVVQCGDLTVDGFSLPIPVEKSIEEYLAERPDLKAAIGKYNMKANDLEKIKKSMHRVSVEAPKTWLPAFKMDVTQKEMDILNDIANGYLEIKDKDGRVVKNETTEGGILLFDEFFRANEQVFKIMMQIILNREYSGYRLGNKWGILCCSNRPNDDEEVLNGFEKTGAVVGTRMLGGAYNFIPSFDEWKKWAISEGGFDDVTIEFLMHDEDNNGEYRNWHTIRPTEYTAKGKTAWPTPRTWSGLMVALGNYMSNHGYSLITEIPGEKVLRIAKGIIGEEMANKYVAWLKQHASFMKVVPKEVLENPEYVIPEKSEASQVVKQLMSYIRIKYSPDDLPDVSLLMNLFNALDKRYPKTKDNFVKMMHVDICKFFKVLSNKANAIALKDYLQAAGDRYSIGAADMK